MKWTDEEIDILKEFYPSEGARLNIPILITNRTISAIQAKAANLGIKYKGSFSFNSKTNEQYLDDLKHTNFICLEKYIGTNVKILHKCKLCNNEWKVRPNQLLISKNTKCPQCDLNNRINNIEYVDDILKAADMERLSEYTGTLHTIKLKHKICGNIWKTKFSYIQQGSGCPLCNKGFGYNINKENLPDIATLYLLKIHLIDNTSFLKIGVTSNKNINNRLSCIKRDLKNKLNTIDVIATVQKSGIDVLKMETDILSKYKRYNIDIIFSGHTELLYIEDQENIVKYMYN